MAALFNEYLMHFCGKEKSPRRAQEVLESILGRGRFIPASCPLFNDPDQSLERRRLQAWAEMVCFTDLRFQDLHHHVAKFGPYGIALKKDSPPARRCSPVHYVEVGSSPQRYTRALEEGVGRLLELQRAGKLDRRWEFPRLLQEYDRRAVASLQDIRTRDENEWRFIPLREGEALEFAPGDVRFILLHTWEQSVLWNRRLNNRREKSLHCYGQAGVLAIPVELLLGGNGK